MEKENAILIFEDVVAGYGNHPVLTGFSASVFPGEFVGLIGANGAGKSTLLKCITGLLPLQSGEILVKGRRHHTYSQKSLAQEVATVPQSFGVDYDFKAEDIVMMGRNPYLGFRDRESEKDFQIVREAMEMTGTVGFYGRSFNALSGGEKQRVIIARAIAQQTDVLLLDEPTSALDIHHQIEVMEMIVRLNRQYKKTVVAVLHDLNLAARYCDRLILLNDGQVMADGLPEAVFTEDYLRRIFSMKMLVQQNHITKRPEIVPLRVLDREAGQASKCIHIIGGGDGAMHLLSELEGCGHQLSMGILPEDSDDYAMAVHFGVPRVSIPPFTDITPEKQQEHLMLMSGADLLYISDVPFGNANVGCLEGLESFDGRIFVHPNALESDYTGGKARAMLQRLIDGCDAVVADDEAFIELGVRGET